jgi:uncharacterized protein
MTRRYRDFIEANFEITEMAYLEITTPQGKLSADIFTANQDTPLIIMCHGFRGSKDENMFVELYKEFQSQNISCIKFDFGNGIGKSYGRIDQITLTNELTDLDCIINYAKQNIQSNGIILLGHSLGGMVCAHYSSHNNDISKLILVSAAYDFENRIKQFFGEENIAKWREGKSKDLYSFIRKGSVFDVGDQFYDDISKYYPEEYKNIKCPTLIVEAENDTSVRADQAEKYATTLVCSIQRARILNADHNYSISQNTIDLRNEVIKFIKNS